MSGGFSPLCRDGVHLPAKRSIHILHREFRSRLFAYSRCTSCASRLTILVREVYLIGKTIGIMHVPESPSLRYFKSASREARRSLGEVWWGRADRRSETKSGREGVRRFYERRIVNLRSFRPFPRHVLCVFAKRPVSQSYLFGKTIGIMPLVLLSF